MLFCNGLLFWNIQSRGDYCRVTLAILLCSEKISEIWRPILVLLGMLSYTDWWRHLIRQVSQQFLHIKNKTIVNVLCHLEEHVAEKSTNHDTSCKYQRHYHQRDYKYRGYGTNGKKGAQVEEEKHHWYQRHDGDENQYWYRKRYGKGNNK